jgi:hypothetical protein
LLIRAKTLRSSANTGRPVDSGSTRRPKLGKIELVGIDVDYPHGIVLADPVFQAFEKQRGLSTIRAINASSGPIAPGSYRENPPVPPRCRQYLGSRWGNPIRRDQSA